ncbi:response regulator transcription factor [Paraburkholderia sp. Cpub6]|uniref:response regulator transcription factor n=1 Tax=Paraburkholderia sp. Cpub6 TaxID=2723094 RepID=UPI0016212201|nr:response regulator [Paraburkholderia sp. Cpub6]MBB5462334.1 FixJ family two-component response regulator [Paraburkholderia sp. Cpub6]
MTHQRSELRTTDAPPRALVVDDNASVREAISELLSSVGIVVKEFPSAQGVLQQLENFNNSEIADANCLILDVRLPGMGGLELQHRLRTAHFNVPIIFISAHGDVRMTVDAMKAGAFDFLSKPFRSQDMLESVEAAVEYDYRRREIDRRQKELLARYFSLTPRERNILALVAKGLMNKQIASELCLSEITIKANRSHLMRKMKAKSVAELVRMEAYLREVVQNQENHAIVYSGHLVINDSSLGTNRAVLERNGIHLTACARPRSDSAE